MRFYYYDIFLNISICLLTITQTVFHATQTHIAASLSPLCLWPPSRRTLNSVHYVISVGCVHTAELQCRGETLRLMNTLLDSQTCNSLDYYSSSSSACVRHDGTFGAKFGNIEGVCWLFSLLKGRLNRFGRRFVETMDFVTTCVKLPWLMVTNYDACAYIA